MKQRAKANHKNRGGAERLSRAVPGLRQRHTLAPPAAEGLPRVQGLPGVTGWAAAGSAEVAVESQPMDETPEAQLVRIADILAQIADDAEAKAQAFWGAFVPALDQARQAGIKFTSDFEQGLARGGLLRFFDYDGAYRAYAVKLNQRRQWRKVSWRRLNRRQRAEALAEWRAQ